MLDADALESDAFTITVRPDAVRIHGDSPRGALNGAYSLLERLGFAWPDPFASPSDERFGAATVEERMRGELREGTYHQAPAFPRRTLILGQDALHDDWPAWMEWASRNRYNDIFFHDTPPSVWDRAGKPRPTTADEIDADRKGWMFERWDS